MTKALGSFVVTEKGARRPQVTECMTGLGAPKAWIKSADQHLLQLAPDTVLLHCLECVGACFTGAPSRQPWSPVAGQSRAIHQPSIQMTGPGDTCQWRPPDLRVGSPWCDGQLLALRRAAQTCGNPTTVVQEGLSILDAHRNNYDANGPTPTQLQLMWWQPPPGHWEAIRCGSRMNFLKDPPAVLHPNAEMTDEQWVIAGQFCDELIALEAVSYTHLTLPTICSV